MYTRVNFITALCLDMENILMQMAVIMRENSGLLCYLFTNLTTIIYILRFNFVRRTITNPKTGQEGPDPDGKRHGMGVRVWTTGAKYMGDWAAGG